ncbi:MAG: tetratricopeptide repeat protein [Planctomycetota bacterium]|nr:MAG: tetratricopeptide repeat protein [Planctomycetota bacterium]REK24804.1 MAG: tetratricopeptide repeat protein [Planctomycetota bacterium]REK38833.1 MAG: tetratricopeptide repeat protein [Planctomycetota bacterium]
MKPRDSHKVSPSPVDRQDSKSDGLLHKVAQLLSEGQPAQALALLDRSNLNSPAFVNARGVCLMRLTRLDDALRLFRSLVLAPGCMWMKPDLPVIYRTNFATILLLTNHPAGCLDVLREVSERDHPSVIRLKRTLEEWVAGLSWHHWMAWKLGLEPSVPVQIDYAPGEVEDPSMRPDTTTPETPPLREAA